MDAPARKQGRALAVGTSARSFTPRFTLKTASSFYAHHRHRGSASTSGDRLVRLPGVRAEALERDLFTGQLEVQRRRVDPYGNDPLLELEGMRDQPQPVEIWLAVRVSPVGSDRRYRVDLHEGLLWRRRLDLPGSARRRLCGGELADAPPVHGVPKRHELVRGGAGGLPAEGGHANLFAFTYSAPTSSRCLPSSPRSSPQGRAPQRPPRGGPHKDTACSSWTPGAGRSRRSSPGAVRPPPSSRPHALWRRSSA